jgi:methylated-DNA-protein-cysteine methyltransferase-like protein
MADEGFFERVYDMVRRIPAGRVTTYGTVAAMLGTPGRARYVGFAMHASPGMKAGVPCHRVVFADGSLVPGFAFGGEGAQRRMLEDEGVAFLPNGHVDMAACFWGGEVPGAEAADPDDETAEASSPPACTCSPRCSTTSATSRTCAAGVESVLGTLEAGRWRRDVGPTSRCSTATSCPPTWRTIPR